MIIIDQDGTSDLECCMYRKCHCSNLSIALEHVQDNTEIRIQSGISLHDAVVFGNVSNVKITGDNNPTVRCDHQGGLVGKNINYIVIQGITWDSCNGITMLKFSDAHIIECNFLNFINFALTLHGLRSININGSTFYNNSDNVDVLAPHITIDGSKFYGNSKSGAIVIKDTNFSDTIVLHSVMLNATITRCEFSGISEHCVHCIGSAGLLPNLSILSSNFTNNMNTAVNIEHCNVTLNNVTFYNNVNVNSGYINDGGAIRIYNGTVNMTGNVLFYYNRAGNNGGAICLNHSVLYASQGPYLFCNNTANNGGAIYIGKSARLHAILNEASLEFLNNSATFSGGAVYIDLHYINDATFSHQLSSYYYNLLTGTSCMCDFSNTADIGNCAYFNENMLSPIILNRNHHSNHIAAALSCSIDINSHQNSTVYVNVTDINSTDMSLKFWTHDLHLAITIMDCYGNPTSPVNVSFQCCDNIDMYVNKFPYNCIIDTEIGSCVVTGTNTIIECFDSNTITCKISTTETTSKIPVTVQRFGHICDDIAHTYVGEVCLPICSPYSSSSYLSSQNCWPQDILPGYWYDNGFTRFVVSCPIGHCKQHFELDSVIYTTGAIFPDRDLQCNNNWGGLACGECNYSAGYAIKYDTTECVSVDKCLTTSVIYSLLILFAVSFFYWIVIISFIFVFLHFKFDITAGYAYGLLFYYSVLDQLVNEVTNHFTESLESSYDLYHIHIFDNYEFMRLKVLPFLSSIGNLRPPFTGFMNLCLGEAKMIDHLMLGYIHPLIVTFLVVIIFILARNFVVVARTIGRFVNSKSICILLLLSYSSITYTSMQLLKPLTVFHSNDKFTMQVYWSPTVKYFHSRHLWYGIIAILCELVIGIGFPLVLIFHRYLIRYCNINFTSIKPIIDQLKGCYKEEYRWFAAYYLLCRQVLYGVNNLFDYCSGFREIETTGLTPFPKFSIVLIISIMITIIHLWVQPYKKKSLNILDNCILLTLVGLLVNSLEITWERMIGVIFWFLPLIILINYLTYFTKLKYLIIPCSCAAVFSTAYLFGTYYNPSVILLLASSFIIFIVYIAYVIKCLCIRCRKIRPRYVAINEQNDEVDTNNNDSNATEVSS